ncbi:tyrosine-protein phosphatase [Caenimonas koreensis]|uniref:Protein-tyrosine-phosphatase n=1 Tax=Caenimonas koreensis DSM 17982 TaxID=1121255 RepID=A0A844BCN5_9BURK|nr:tyrosine-protein phosphatase [Caenimonas koreensis]MRD49326.1 protein-tyrosine-phosphatase [Caenimonas koreensis DSM 17982]
MDPKINGAFNFRDLKSPAVLMPRLRPRLLYRSDHLGALDEDDASHFRALGIRRVLDFRGIFERAEAVCPVPTVTVHSLAIEPTVVQVLGALVAAGEKLTREDAVAHMQDTYRGFVRQNTHRFAEFFAHLMHSDTPTVFHCTAGKDRTGFAAALILHALGATHDDVMRDYLLTNQRLKPMSMKGWSLPAHVVEVLYGVRPEFLQAAYQAIDEDYGSLEGYFSDGLHLGAAERRRLLELYLL